MVFDPLEPLRRDISRVAKSLGFSENPGRQGNPTTRKILKVTTDAPLFYRYLTEQEVRFRRRDHPLKLSDVTALGSHYAEFEISEEELDRLVARTPQGVSPYDKLMGWVGAHHKVWIGKWELGMSWDRKLVYAKRA